MIEIVFLICGLILLIKGGEFLVDGSSKFAKNLGIASIVIGLTIVAFGTSMPEFFVNVFAAKNGNSELSLGNIIGSNIANILLILGVGSLISLTKFRKETVWKELPFSLLATFLLFLIAINIFNNNSTIGFLQGIILLIFFLLFLFYIYLMIKKSKKSSVLVEENEIVFEKEVNNENFFVKYIKPLFFVFLGIILLYFGGKLTVDNAIIIAKTFGLSDFLISATIIALGTSLPELVTTIVAIIKKEPDIAVGNIIGSNIFNIFFILGITSLISPVIIPSSILFDLVFLLVITILLFIFMFTGGTKHVVEKWEGAILILVYFCYLGFIIFRG